MWISKDEFWKVKDREWRRGFEAAELKYGVGKCAPAFGDAPSEDELPDVPPIERWVVEIYSELPQQVDVHAFRSNGGFTDGIRTTGYEWVRSQGGWKARPVQIFVFRVQTSSLRSMRRIDVPVADGEVAQA